MSSSDVKTVIAKKTSHLEISEALTLLACVGHSLVPATDQHPSGDVIINEAQKRKAAALYICPDIKVHLPSKMIWQFYLV